MDPKKRYAENLQLLHDTAQQKKTSRVPFGTVDAFWRYHDCGYKLSEVLSDYKKLNECNVRFCKKYQIDLILDIGARNPMQFTKTLGNDQYIIDDVNNTLIIKEQNHWTPEDYDHYVEDPLRTFWQYVMPRKYTKLNKNMTVEDLASFAEAFLVDATMMGKTQKEIETKTGALGINEPGNLGILIPMEASFNFWRGFRGTAMDMRRCPEKIDAFSQAMWGDGELFLGAIKPIEQVPAAFGTEVVLLSHNGLSTKQWERFVWPYLKQVDERIRKTGSTSHILAEGSTKNITDFLSELAPDSYVMTVEQDDIIERRKSLPNMGLEGGLPLNLLGKGTVEENLDMTKKLIDEVGPGLVIASNKFTCNPEDCKAENLKAVGDYLHKDCE